MGTLEASGISLTASTNDANGGDRTNDNRAIHGTSESNIEIPTIAPNYVDITDVFSKETQKIKPGELAMSETFELVNAINALEMMDLKMDTGLLDMLSHDKEFDTKASRSARKVLGVMDELFAMEMSWHTGGALSQTVFTCLYIEQALNNFNGSVSSAHFGDESNDVPIPSDKDLESVFVHVVLREFVLGIIKTCDLSRRRLQCNEILEDEDIVTQTYSLDLMQFVPVADICTGLIDAISKMKQLQTETEIHHNQEASNLLGCIDGFISRLELRLMVIKALDSADDVPEKQIELLDGTGDLIRTVMSTHSLAEPLPVAFSIAIQGRLECGMPPRPKVETSFGDGIRILERLLSGMKDVLRVHDYGSLGDITAYFEEFAMRRPTELPYVRCQLFKRFLVNRKIVGKFSMRDAVIADITDLCCPSPALFAIDESHSCHQALEMFFTRAEVCFENLFSVMCHNRSRLRQRLCGVILDWDSLQVDSEHLESNHDMLEFSPLLSTDQRSGEEGLRALPLSSWVYFRKLQIMVWIVFMGFELDIYRLDEWPLMLWYGDYVLGVMDSHIARIEMVLEIMAAMPPDSSTHSTKPRKSKKNKGKLASVVPPPSPQSIMRSRSWLAGLRSQMAAYKELCQGYMCFIAALVRAGCVRSFAVSQLDQSKKEFMTPELLYRLRLKPFSTIGVPEVPSFETYKRLSDLRDWQIDPLLDNAQITVNKARNMTDAWSKLKPEQQVNSKLVQESSAKMQQNLKRSCIGTNVAISVVRQMKLQPGSFGKENKLKISIQHDNFHPFFPTLSVSTGN
ncbi:Mak10 subunit, NatC N-terminal acetyltransferase-domain-containing protein [Lipomyces tetrasporus]